jgi:hypothetical protein
VVFGLVSRLLRLASIAICAIAILWFVSFALDQSKAASAHQQAQVGASEPARTNTSKKESAGHEAIDKAFSALSSPFSGIAAGSDSAWTVHIVDTLLVVVVYGFGLAFLARLLRLNP